MSEDSRKNEPLTILETTLRDGSYAINFEFTARDTALICKALDGAGFRLIEIGHGIGLGASRHPKWRAAETDEAYLAAAAENVDSARWGMFCIPGIARLEDIDIASDYGMKFIRVGFNVADVGSAEPFVARAKKHGMYVSVNFMKSYTMVPEKFAEKAKLAESFGADILSIVDSAGGMLSGDIENYFKAVQDQTDIPLGFHGHNNMDMAVANSLKAVECGASVVDTSLQGMGRSAGNTPTEIFLLALERMGRGANIDPIKVMDISEKYIKPMMKGRHYNSVDIVSGYAQFHSSYFEVIKEFSNRYGVDPRRLIIEVCKENKIDAPRDLVERKAKALSVSGDDVYTARFLIDSASAGEQEGAQD